MKIKESRALSFTAVAIVYIIAALAGVAIYRALSLPFWLALLIADVGATVVTFIFSLIFENASVYDPYWSVQPIFILVCFAAGRSLTPLGVLLLIAVCFWGVRLTANWVYTFHGLTHEDWRYVMLHEKTGKAYPLINFIGIHMVPTLGVYGCILPAVFAIAEAAPPTVGSVIFVCVSFAAVILQGYSDILMHRFRRSGTGGFIRTGPWKYARHPNYLGEICMWWGIGLACVCAMPERWWLLAGALANTLLFIFVSVPMADGRQSKKPGFAEYKKQTRVFFPIRK
jgi:steroid 5-alpha reductase family enzyme